MTFAQMVRENWGFIVIGGAGGLAWAIIGFYMHLAHKALAPVRPPDVAVRQMFDARGVDRSEFFRRIAELRSEPYLTDEMIEWAFCGAGVHSWETWQDPRIIDGERAARRRVANAAIRAFLAANRGV